MVCCMADRPRRRADAAEWADSRKSPSSSTGRGTNAARFKRNDAMVETLPIGPALPRHWYPDNAKKLGVPVWKSDGARAPPLHLPCLLDPLVPGAPEELNDVSQSEVNIVKSRASMTDIYFARRRMKCVGSEARNKTRQTQRSTISL